MRSAEFAEKDHKSDNNFTRTLFDT